MPNPPRQATRRIGGGVNNSQQKSSSKFRVTPETILFGLFFVWLVVCVQFYRNNSEVSVAPRTRLNAPDNNNINEPTNSNGQSNNNNDSIDNVGNNDNNSFPEHYMTFSTACSPSQNWQSFMFFYYAHKVSQPGHVIRIAWGCSDQQKDDVLKFHDQAISKLSNKFSVHFTPDFAKISGDNYKYYNKPFGIQHWLRHGLKYDKTNKEMEDAIIMILDPDMILLRPLTYDFTDSNVIIHQSKLGPPKIRKVMHGQPWASLYGFGNGPFKQDLKYIFANHTDSPGLHTSGDEQMNNYAGGPPYMATGRDMVSIVNAWCELVPRVHHVYKHLLGEMFGWSLGAAHVGLPHTLAESFMISATEIGSGEGWPLIDVLSNDEITEFSTLKEKEDKLPYVIHYCQNYWLGKWFVGKYRLDSDFLSCEKPLLLEPPKDIGSKYDFYIKPGGNPYGKKENLRPSVVKRETFMVSQMIARLNDAASWYKEQTCEEGTANYKKEFIFHHSLDPDNNDGGEKKAKW